MDTQEIVKHLTSGIANRKEYLALAVDRGLGEGMQIEKWLLTEMLARLIQLKRDGVLSAVEGEHKYPKKKGTRYEHCDLWWRVDNQEYWLEVKTVVPQEGQQQWSKQIRGDLGKGSRLRATDVFHHLTFVFPVEASAEEVWRQQVTALYQSKGFLCEAIWTSELWNHQELLMLMFTKARR